MTDNLHLGPEAAVNHSLALLRAQTFEKTVAPRVDLVPGIFVSVDPEASVVGMISSTPGNLLSLRLSPEPGTRWMSVHMMMGATDLHQVQMLGVVCRSQAPRSITFRVALRSGVGTGFVDTMFRKTVVAYGEPSIHMDVIDLAREPAVPQDATWREIIVMFDLAPVELTFLNFGVFSI